MHPDAPYFSILLCLTPDNFTRQVESADTQWVKILISTYILHFSIANIAIYVLPYVTPSASQVSKL
jgi:hypothetical protein